jgi:hypothetical protein
VIAKLRKLRALLKPEIKQVAKFESWFCGATEIMNTREQGYQRRCEAEAQVQGNAS